jgi:hypothetical protein
VIKNQKLSKYVNQVTGEAIKKKTDQYLAKKNKKIEIMRENALEKVGVLF